MNGDAAYDQDIQTIRDYAQAVADLRTKIAIAYTQALGQVRSTLQTASPDEAKPDIVKAMLKSGLKSFEKGGITAVQAQTGANLAPITDMIHAIYDEVDRATTATTSLDASEWIQTLSESAANSYTQAPDSGTLRQQLEREYNDGDEGERNYYIAGVQIELEAVGEVQVPKTEALERETYEEWINQHFTEDCVAGAGVIVLHYDSEGNPQSAVVHAPLGSRIAGGLNRILSASGISQLMDLAVNKKVCMGDTCMCFESDNRIRLATNDETAETFLTDADNWKRFKRFQSEMQ